MADIKAIEVDGVSYDIKDAAARSQIGDLSELDTEEKSSLVRALNEVASAAAGGSCGITYLESTDTNNPVSIRDLASGTYVFYGRFKPFATSTSTLTFSSQLLVNVVKQSSASHVMVFYPVNNCVQYLKATDTEYTRKNIYLNDLQEAIDIAGENIGTLTNLATTDKSSLVAAINEVVASVPKEYTHPATHPASMITGLATVATSGSYNDLSNKPSIPAAYTHPSTHPASMITGLATVATSGKYSDLSGTPTIPTVPTALKNPNALTFTGAATGSYDGSAAKTINIPTVPSSLKNPNAMTINGMKYDGSAAVDFTASVNSLIAAAADSDTTTTMVPSDNLFDKSIAVTKKTFYHSSSGPSIIDSYDSNTKMTGFYAYVPLRGAGVYRTVIWWAMHGESYATRVPILKQDKTFMQNLTGTLTKIDGTFAYLEFTVTEAMVSSGAAIYAYDGMANEAAYDINKVMIVKDMEYPSTYQPYGYIEVEVGGAKAANILSGKTAVFLGDSICAGTTTLADAKEYGWGWAGLIGEGNKMVWKNYGRNGGTIAPLSSVDQVRWVPYQVDLAAAQYPDADYVIFEGGTNDADTMGASALGTFSTSGYAPASTADFTGAFETLVLKILNAYPNAKVGYIVAPKMGAYNDYSGTSNNRRKFFDRAVEICKKWGIPVIDLWDNNPMNPKLAVYYDSSLTADQANTNGKFYTDGQHLTLTGYQRITPQIEAFMRSL